MQLLTNGTPSDAESLSSAVWQLRAQPSVTEESGENLTNVNRGPAAVVGGGPRTNNRSIYVPKNGYLKMPLNQAQNRSPMKWLLSLMGVIPARRSFVFVLLLVAGLAAQQKDRLAGPIHGPTMAVLAGRRRPGLQPQSLQAGALASVGPSQF